MKNIFLIIGILFLFSCEKASEFEKTTFIDIQPDKELTTYGDSNSLSLYNNNIKWATKKPWVNDTIFSSALSETSLDLNKDGNEDFVIEMEHKLRDVSEDILHDRFVIKFNSKNLNQISLTDKEMGYIKSYEFNQMIDTTSFCVNDGFSKENLGGFIVSIGEKEDFKLFGDYYIAIRLFEEEKLYYGWIHIKVEFFKLTICDYAISNEPSTLLVIGQL